MLSISLYKKLLWSVSISSLFLLTGWSYAYDGTKLKTSLNTFMSEILDNSQINVKEKIYENLHFENNSAFSVALHEGSLYSLVVMQVPYDKNPDALAELEVITQNRALLEAQMRLAFYLGQGGVDRNLFRYDDALGTALLTYYSVDIKDKKLRGIQTAASVLDGRNSVAGLAWLSSPTVKILGEHIPENGVLDDDYCKFLYINRALILFEAGNYAEALPVFKNIHDFKWSNVSAYLDASECFLRTGHPEECVKLLKELIISLDEKMTSENLQRAGRLFREAEDKESAKDAFTRARKRYHDENKKTL